MSDMFQNSIVMASEFSNESIATKAKFEKNIIAHALGLGITDINAKPAQMNVFLIFLEQDIINWANASTAKYGLLVLNRQEDVDMDLFLQQEIQDF